MGWAQITDAGLAYIANFPKLKTLDLQHTLVTDAGMTRLSGLTNLERFCLVGTKVTDAGISRLQNLTNITHLTQSDAAKPRLTV